MIDDRLGIITDEVSHDLAEALEWVTSHRLRHVELRTVQGKNISQLSDSDVEVVLSMISRWNVPVSCIASPVFKCALSPERPVQKGDMFGVNDDDIASHYETLERVIDIANKLGARFIRVFSFWREEQPSEYMKEIAMHLRNAADLAHKRGVTLLLENEPTCNGGYADEVAFLVNMVNSVALRALWDPGNEAYAGRSAYPTGYTYVRDVVGHVHLKDAKYGEGGVPYCVPIGQGVVPYYEQIMELLERGYQGLFTLETHYVPVGGTPREGSEESLKGILQVIERIRSNNR